MSNPHHSPEFKGEAIRQVIEGALWIAVLPLFEPVYGPMLPVRREDS